MDSGSQGVIAPSVPGRVWPIVIVLCQETCPKAHRQRFQEGSWDSRWRRAGRERDEQFLQLSEGEGLMRTREHYEDEERW